MAGELVLMSTREIDRMGVVKQVLQRELTRVKAAKLLGLGPKQVSRLCAAFERDGAAGLYRREYSSRIHQRRAGAHITRSKRTEHPIPAAPFVLIPGDTTIA